MKSRWFDYKDQAVSLRKNGFPIREIEDKLKIPRSTLSGWFKGVKLTKKQKDKINKNWKKAIKKGREKAVIWHNKQKENRLLEAKFQANLVLKDINIEDKHILELALSMLYLGEGAKGRQTSMANSNPQIIIFFVKCLFILYGIKAEDMKYYLHLRSDQNGEKLKKYWSTELGVPIKNVSFTKDKRTIKSKTYPNYKGVCDVEVGRVAIRRRLSFISDGFCARIQGHTDP